MDQLTQYIIDMKFIPGGRYLYYARRPLHFWNNCFLLKPTEDSREAWGELVRKATDCLMAGGGIGSDYSIIRPKGRALRRTGGISSGPLSLMMMVNEIGRYVMQGGSRRSAIFGCLNWQHDDIMDFIHAKDWSQQLRDIKENDFNFPAPMDMTNISVSWDTDFIEDYIHTGTVPTTWTESIKQMLKTGEPGHSYNFYENEDETLRNAPVSADTYVLTSDGYTTIRDIVNTPVKVWTGKQWAKTKFKKTADSAEIIEVHMTGGRVIKAEPNHPFMVERWKGKGKNKRKLTAIDRVNAKDLKVGDTLNVSLPTNYIIPTFCKSAYTLGFAYGDGHFNKNGGEISLCSDTKKSLISYLDTTMFKSIRTDSNGKIRCYLKTSVGKDRTKDKYPALKWDEIASFIAGLFDADGCDSNGRIRLSSKHEGFLHDVRRSLEQIGILSGVNVGSKGGFKGTPTYMLVVMAEYLDIFRRLIPTKRLKVDSAKPYRKSQIKVKALKAGNKESVYCCDVGVKEHTFTAEGIVISNCTEVTSEDDSDVCNLGSINLGNIESISELRDVTCLAAKFLVNGTIRGDLPYSKVYDVRRKNRRIGLGIMGVHEWLLQRRKGYEVDDELKQWLEMWKCSSEIGAREQCNKFSISHPVKYRAIAPTGTIGILASTTTGIEPLYATAYKRRYLVDGTKWKYEYVVDATAERLIQEHGLDSRDIETSFSLANDPEKRIKFQYDIQKYVDHAISSTINLPAWGSDVNNPDKVPEFSRLFLKYCQGLRGITVYPDGARGGQPLTEVEYDYAKSKKGVIYDETEEKCSGGICGI